MVFFINNIPTNIFSFSHTNSFSSYTDWNVYSIDSIDYTSTFTVPMNFILTIKFKAKILVYNYGSITFLPE